MSGSHHDHSPCNRGYGNKKKDILLMYSYPRSFSPRSRTCRAAVKILVELMSQAKAFQEFQPRAGTRPFGYQLILSRFIRGVVWVAGLRYWD